MQYKKIICTLSGFFMFMVVVDAGWAQQKPVIAITIDEMENRAIAINGGLTFSFLPFTTHARELQESARKRGRENDVAFTYGISSIHAGN